MPYGSSIQLVAQADFTCSACCVCIDILGKAVELGNAWFRLISGYAYAESRFFATFEAEITKWQKSLATIGEITQILREVERSWTFLENLFLCSEEVKRELPAEAERFVAIDAKMKELLRQGETYSKIKDFCVMPEISTQLDELQKQLSMCEKALNEFMDSKRKTFPRFFFVSSVDLLDILSHGNDPPAVMVHMPKIFQAIQQFDCRDAQPTDKDKSRPVATGITSCVGIEQLALPEEMTFVGKVSQNCFFLFISRVAELHEFKCTYSLEKKILLKL